MHGGGERIRTDDLLLAKQALSRLSYTPGSGRLVGLGRLELPTSRLSGVRSNRLSYRPAATAVERQGACRRDGTHAWKGYAGGGARYKADRSVAGPASLERR